MNYKYFNIMNGINNNYVNMNTINYQVITTCGICDLNKSFYNCNKCGNCICDNEECCLIFPHYYNTLYYVCKNCFERISLKLILQIDLGKIELLKNKIRNGTTYSSPCSSRSNSRNSNDNNCIINFHDNEMKNNIEPTNMCKLFTSD